MREVRVAVWAGLMSLGGVGCGGGAPAATSVPVATSAPVVAVSAAPTSAPAAPPEKGVLEKAMAAITKLPAPPPAREPKLPGTIVVPPSGDLRGAEERCTKGDMAGCREAGRLHFEGWGISRDREKARTFAAKACNAGDVEACLLQSRVASNSIAPDDPAGAAEPAKRACALGSPEGCARLIRLWAEAAARGRPWTTSVSDAWIGDATAARAASERLCEADVRGGCVARGFLGFSDVESYKATLRWLAERCGRGVMDACYANQEGKLWSVAREKGWKEQEFDAAEKELQTRWVASRLDQCHRTRRDCRGIGFDKKGREASRYLWAACVEGLDFTTCSSLAQQIHEASPGGGDKALQVALRAENCLHAESLGDIVECSDAGYRYTRGDQVPKDEARAFVLYARRYAFRRAECDRWAPGAESYSDCRMAALQLEDGQGVQRDLAAALALYARGCTEAKDRDSCEGRDRVKKLMAQPPQAAPPSK